MSGGIKIQELKKQFGEGDRAVLALKNVNMEVSPGEVVGLIGPSGSGKSTLLKCLGAVMEPTSGKMSINGEIIYDNKWLIKDLGALRRDKIGFIFQAPYLIPFLNAIDNVALLPMLAGKGKDYSRKIALNLLKELDVHHRAHALPSALSSMTLPLDFSTTYKKIIIMLKIAIKSLKLRNNFFTTYSF
jgi:putative ABC transport system ATP-binding protein